MIKEHNNMINIPIIPVGTTLVPRVREGVILTGFAIIYDTYPTHPDTLACMLRWDQYTEDEYTLVSTSYNVITDFGNTLKMTYAELLGRYDLGKVDDVKERLARQMTLLREFHEELEIKGLEELEK